MRLETERLIVRPWTLDDAEQAFVIYGDPEVMRYIGDGTVVADLDTMREKLAERIERDRGLTYGGRAVESKATGEVIGGGALRPLPDGSDFEVGYHFAKRWWGQGYASEVTPALVRYGFNELGLTRIVGVTYPENVASQRVLLKSGLELEGTTTYLNVEVLLFAVHAGV